MENKQTSFSQAIDEHVLHAHINKFLTDSARYLELDTDAVNMQNLPRLNKGKVIRKNQEVCYATIRLSS